MNGVIVAESLEKVGLEGKAGQKRGAGKNATPGSQNLIRIK